MSVKQPDPLTWNVPIVDGRGQPTPEFMRKYNQQQAANASNSAAAAAAAAAAAKAIAARKTGFGFFDAGLYSDHELLGSAVFSETVTFPSQHNTSSVTSLLAATANAVFTVVTGAADTQIGTITFAAGAKSAAVVWSPSPYALPAGQPLRLYSPAPADVSLGYVTGLLLGDAA